jgi:hypothetical protein
VLVRSELLKPINIASIWVEENYITRSSKLYSSPNRIIIKTSRMMRWTGRVACMRVEEFIRDFGGKESKKEISVKTKT